MNENFLKISHLTKSVKQTEVDQDDIEQHLTSDNKISPRQSSQISENFNVQVRRIFLNYFDRFRTVMDPFLGYIM